MADYTAMAKINDNERFVCKNILFLSSGRLHRKLNVKIIDKIFENKALKYTLRADI